MVYYLKKLYYRYIPKKNREDVFSSVVKKFGDYLSVEQGLGKVTVEGYIKSIKKFIKDTGLGTASGIKTTHSTADIYFEAGGYRDIYLYNTILASGAEFSTSSLSGMG